jgi:hypothetical protein
MLTVNQKDTAISIGTHAGRENQGSGAIAFGDRAGVSNQGNYAVAIGKEAGKDNQGPGSISIGDQAGKGKQGVNAISIGSRAGLNTQGMFAIAIGAVSGINNQPANSIFLNATQEEVSMHNTGLYIAPIRESATGSNILGYNTQTKEVTTTFPELPRYDNDNEATDAYLAINDSLPRPGTLYYNMVLNTPKFWNSKEWIKL